MDKFYGYYYKLEKDSDSMAFIVALHQSEDKPSASLQVIVNGDNYFKAFDAKDFSEVKNKNEHLIRLCENTFSDSGLHLDVAFDKIRINGNIEFCGLHRIDGDIMGPFRFVPFMECRHMLRSAFHTLKGALSVGGKNIDLGGGKGYIEGDRGRRFPSSYFWLHAFLPNVPDGSAMLSVAEIPYMGIRFTGVIGFVLENGHEHRIATYHGAKIVKNSNGSIEIRQGRYTYRVEIIDKQTGNPLRAPQGRGNMSRTICETLRGRARICLICDGHVIFDGVVPAASYEYEY